MFSQASVWHLHRVWRVCPGRVSASHNAMWQADTFQADTLPATWKAFPPPPPPTDRYPRAVPQADTPMQTPPRQTDETLPSYNCVCGR